MARSKFAPNLLALSSLADEVADGDDEVGGTKRRALLLPLGARGRVDGDGKGVATTDLARDGVDDIDIDIDDDDDDDDDNGRRWNAEADGGDVKAAVTAAIRTNAVTAPFAGMVVEEALDVPRPLVSAVFSSDGLLLRPATVAVAI